MSELDNVNILPHLFSFNDVRRAVRSLFSWIFSARCGNKKIGENEVITRGERVSFPGLAFPAKAAAGVADPAGM